MVSSPLSTPALASQAMVLQLLVQESTNLFLLTSLEARALALLQSRYSSTVLLGVLLAAVFDLGCQYKGGQQAAHRCWLQGFGRVGGAGTGLPGSGTGQRGIDQSLSSHLPQGQNVGTAAGQVSPLSLNWAMIIDSSSLRD